MLVSSSLEKAVFRVYGNVTGQMNNFISIMSAFEEI